MSGVLFVVHVPTAKFEMSLIENANTDAVGRSQVPENVKPKKDLRKKLFINTLSTNSRSHSEENISRGKHSANGESARAKSAEIFSETQEDNEVLINLKLPLERVLEEVLNNLKISNAIWNSGTDGMHKQVTFCVASGRPCEDALRLLIDSGIGVKSNSIVSVIPCSLYYQGNESNLSPTGKNELDIADDQEQYESEANAWGRILESARPRLIVAQVVQTVKHNATLTFDFLVLLIIAAFTAALALVENSIVILVASMLISPLMGPIMAGMFGTVIRDRKLQKMGVCNELLGLLLCVLIGFLFGILVGITGNHWVIGTGDWPTDEMISMGALKALWVGVMVALLSGAAVAIAILGDNTGSLIGVALSVALLPPAVNAGLLWSLSVVNLLFDDSIKFSRHYSPLWSPKPNLELAILGGLSLCLTIINIICIFLAGILVLKLKEIAPRGLNSSDRRSWNPLKIARDYQTLANEEGTTLPDKIIDDVMSPNELISEEMRSRWRMLSNTCADMPYPSNIIGLNQFTWSPASSYQPYRPSAQDLTSLLHLATVRHQNSRCIQAGSNWILGGGFRSRAPSPTLDIMDECATANSPKIETSQKVPRFIVTQVHTPHPSSEANLNKSS